MSRRRYPLLRQNQNKPKEIIVEVKTTKEAVEAVAKGASALFAPYNIIPPELRDKVKIYNEETGTSIISIKTPSDVELIHRAAMAGASAILVETSDIRIIPLENVLAKLQGMNTEVLVRVDKIEDIETLFGVLEKGVDGIVYSPSSIEEVSLLRDFLNYVKKVELVPARVKEVINAGIGERACIDTTTMLRIGEGLLVGSMSRMLFLVHSEVIGSSFTEPRPFRINAGAIHLYTLGPLANTYYLSELKAGKRVLVVSKDGSTRVATIGRVKIERRPLMMISAEIDNTNGSVIVQNAETIRLVDRNGEPIEVTRIGAGDEVLVHLSGISGRHMGMKVEESINEV
ncbi:MAG: 3-dehydroquinate synthase II [Nitrososphaerota archaeon]